MKPLHCRSHQDCPAQECGIRGSFSASGRVGEMGFFFFFLGERAGYPWEVPDGQEFRVCLFLPDTKAKQVFYLLPGKVSKMVVLTNRSSCKTQRTSRSHILCPRHLPLAPWVEPAEPREAECARNVLPHLLPMGMSPAIYPAWACWGMPAKPSWMPPGACLLGPQWSVRTSTALLPFHSMPGVLLILQIVFHLARCSWAPSSVV